MKFCLTQAITHSPSSDFCEVPARRMLLMMSLKRLPGICSYELLPACLWFERETLLKWQKIQSMEVHQQSKTLPRTSLYFGVFFSGKNWKNKVCLICTSSMGGRKSVEKSFCILWIPLALGLSSACISVFCSELQCVSKPKYDKFFHGSVTTAACRLLSTQELLP